MRSSSLFVLFFLISLLPSVQAAADSRSFPAAVLEQEENINSRSFATKQAQVRSLERSFGESSSNNTPLTNKHFTAERLQHHSNQLVRAFPSNITSEQPSSSPLVAATGVTANEAASLEPLHPEVASKQALNEPIPIDQPGITPAVSEHQENLTEGFLSDPARVGGLVGGVTAGALFLNPLAPILGNVIGYFVGKSSHFSEQEEGQAQQKSAIRPIITSNTSVRTIQLNNN